MGKGVYIGAVVVVIAIMAALLFSVKMAEYSQAARFNDEIRQFALENELQSAYADFDTNNRAVYCTVINQSIANLSQRADVLEWQLATFKDNSVNTQEFFTVKRNYLLTNMVLFRSFLKAKEYCDLNTKAVLFFYAEDNSCVVECGIVGAQLSQLQKHCSSFRSFNFPYAWPAYEFTKILEVKYGVLEPGTLVIDGNKMTAPVSNNDLSRFLGCS